MAFKDIVVFVDSSSASTHRLLVAAELAQRYSGHLIGVYIVPAAHHIHDGFVRGEAAMRALAKRRRQEEEYAVLKVGRSFAEVAARHDIQAEFRLILNSDENQNVVLNSLYADLVIVGKTGEDGLPQHWLSDRLLLGSGVPVLVIPKGWSSDKIGVRVAVAWNASKEARRAVTDALPLLSTASSVKILIVDAKSSLDRHGEEPGANIARHLARHGANVEVESISSGDVSTASRILNVAYADSVDLIVMGAHSHSRSSQLLFGSVTRAILKDATVPVFLAR